MATPRQIERALREEGFAVMMTTKEVARATGYAPRTIRTYRARGDLPAVGPGAPRHLRTDVARFIAGS